MKPHLSWSQMSMLSRCPVQFEWRYIKGVIRPPAVALIVGSGTHKSIEANMREKQEHGKLLPDNVVMDAARDAVNERWKEGVALDDEEKSRGEKSVRGDAVDTAVSLAYLHHTDLAPDIRPEHVEREWRIVIPEASRDIIGYIDIQEREDRNWTIRDTKTSGKSPPADAAWNSDQLTMYALASHVLDKRIPPLALDYLVKTKTPKTVVQTTTRTIEDFQPLLARISVALKLIDAGVFMPCAQDSYVCSRKFCGYWSQCVYARKRVVTGPE